MTISGSKVSREKLPIAGGMGDNFAVQVGPIFQVLKIGLA
jgi:hypothetical protein